MGTCFSISCAADQFIIPVLCCLCVKASHSCNLEDNLVELRRDLDVLIARRDGVLSRVKDEELKGRQRLALVALWLTEIETIETSTKQLADDASAQVPSSQDASAQVPSSQDSSAQDIFSQDASAVHQRLLTSGCCPMNIKSNYVRGEKVFKMLNEVRSISSRGEFDVVAETAPPPVVEIKYVQQTFGLPTTLENIWKILMDDENRMLGIYGMGGIGKTTILALINNRFFQVQGDFDVVIWVKVSEDADIGKIQDKIGKRLGLYDEKWCTYTINEKSGEISRVLTHMKTRFVLLLDGLWKEVSLTAIGIPFQTGGKKNKVVFTTRSKDVCGKMRAKGIKVECLAEKDALDLFKQHSGRDNLKDEMLDLATEIARKCHRLPLALEVVGKSLSSRTTADEWRDALTTLQSFPDMLGGMEEEMFCVLKLSYDYLPKEDAKLCFQYCALFPEAYNIGQEELVEYWIGEDILDGRRGRERAKSRGSEIINTLVGASLLLKDDESKRKVYMHDMIREMALWIVSERYLVKTNAGLSQLPDVTDWTTVTKMSLMNNEIEGIPDDPEFPAQACLITLFLQNNRLVEIVGNFFVVMSTLVVLDLSRNLGITKLPEEISMLVSLRYLKLLGTMIKDLPSGFGALVKLIHLDLESTSRLQNISLISGLLKLQVLRFYGSAAALDLSLLEKLECLKGLELSTITVRDADVLKALVRSKLAGCTQGLYLQGLEVSDASFASTFSEFRSLCNLEMINCDIIESDTEWEENSRHQYPPSTSSSPITPSNTWFKNLVVVVLLSCEHLRDLTWLIYAANLESLSITLSPKLEELISKKKAAGVGVEPFLKLEVLCLDFLDELKSIYWSTLSFPRLHQVNIKNCSMLHKLPLNSTSVERIDDLHIEVEEGWLKKVEWENGAKDRFFPRIRTTPQA